MPATPSMQNDFDRWNNIKKRLAPTVSPSSPFPQRGEVWMCTLGKNLGREQDGSARDFSRPVLVVHKFNNDDVIAREAMERFYAEEDGWHQEHLYRPDLVITEWRKLAARHNRGIQRKSGVRPKSDKI